MEITRDEIKGFLNTIGISASLDNEYFTNRQVIKDIYSEVADGEITIKKIPELINEIEKRVLREIDPERESDIYFYFNYLDSQFDGKDEKMLEKAEKIWNKQANY